MKVQNVIAPCFFCDPTPEYICYELDHFRVHIDPYPLCANHVLVSSREHYGCAGELSDELLEELSQLESRLSRVLSDFSDSWTLYEHGRSGACQSSPEVVSCYHMHLHFLPSSHSIHDDLGALFHQQPVHEWKDLRKWFHGYGEYLLFRDCQNVAKCYFAKGTTVPSHLLRTMMAEKLGRPELADWEHYRDDLLYRKSCAFKEEINSALQGCHV